MHQNSPSPIQSFLNESIGNGKLLDDVLFGQIVDLDEQMRELCRQGLLRWRSEDGDDVGDVSLLESISRTEGEDSAVRGNSGDGSAKAHSQPESQTGRGKMSNAK